MKPVSKFFSGMTANLLYFVVVPISQMATILLADPYDISAFISSGTGSFSLVCPIVAVISCASLALSRMLLFILRNHLRMKWPQYILWCICEIVIACLFLSILLGIMLRDVLPYFTVMTRCILYFGSVMLIPYTVITMGIQIYVLSHQNSAAVTDEATLIRFYDENRRLRIIISSDAVLYIAAEENYVNIFYLDGGRVRKFNLRSSMSALEDNLLRHGLLRCHRSYYINPAHVSLLKKDGGNAVACLDVPGEENIPISKTYYDSLASLL